MPLDVERARRGIREKIAEPLGLELAEAARGIIKIAVAKMSLAVRGVSVERGFDPRDFALVAFGGAGPAHAAEIARELSIPTVIVPRLPAHFSALGMLMADLRHDYVRTYYRPLSEADFGEMRAILAELCENGRQILLGEGTRPEAINFHRFLDMRYVGQEFCIQVPIGEGEVVAADRTAIRKRFGTLIEVSKVNWQSPTPRGREI